MLRNSRPIHSENTCNIILNYQLAERLKQTVLVILNEIFMTHRHNHEAVDRTLHDLCRFTFSFGGIPVLLMGNFWQILPVVPAANWSPIFNTCFKRLGLFPLFTSSHSYSNMRLLALHNYPHATPSAFFSYPICFALEKESFNKLRKTIKFLLFQLSYFARNI